MGDRHDVRLREREMNGIVWLWKHRHCWEQLEYLYEQRTELKRILRSIHINEHAPSEFQADEEKDPQTIDAILERLREFDRVPLVREWAVSPPPRKRVHDKGHE